MNLKSFRKFFSWHLVPEESVKIQSVVEIAVFLLVASGLLFLFVKWNEVPVRHIKIYSEAINYREAFNHDSVHYLPYREWKFQIPATNNRDLISDSAKVKLVQGFFQYDPLRDNKRWKSIVVGSDASYTTSKTMRETFKNKYCPNYHDENLMWDSVVMNKPYYVSPFPSARIVVDKEAKGDTINEYYFDADVDDSIVWRSYYGYNFKKYDDYNDFNGKERTRRTPGIFDPGYLYDLFFGGDSPMVPPRWGRLEDISQAYYDVELNTTSIDSLILGFDFLGAVEFSKMTPEPDVISMSSLEFNDIRKIKEIKDHGLRFHVEFKELAIRQQIRLFFVTAILSGLITIFLVFLVLAMVKFNRHVGKYIVPFIKNWKEKKKEKEEDEVPPTENEVEEPQEDEKKSE